VNDAQRYPAQVFYSDEDEGFIAVATDLPGCSAFGETQEEAVAELRNAIDAWQMAAEKAGNPIPGPSKHHLDDLPSGKILLRLPRSLHAQLIDRAKQESVSLNQHIMVCLAASSAASFARDALVHHISEFKHYWNQAFSQRSQSISQVVMIYVTGHENAVTRQFQPVAEVYPITNLIAYSPTGEAIHG
jgi:predicted RNase H-like HicB family nuclease